jgi:WD40 repeat protein
MITVAIMHSHDPLRGMAHCVLGSRYVGSMGRKAATSYMMARFSVGVVSAPPDGAIARTICGYLADQGIDIVDPPPRRTGQHSEVVLLSRGSLENTEFVQAIATPDGHRRVPVVIGDVGVDADGLPEDLRKLNWIPWDNDNLERSLALILSASQTDLGVYRHARSTETKALAWHRNHRGKDELITDLKQIEHLIAKRTGGDEQVGYSEQSFLVEEFLQASLRRSKSLRRWRRLRIALAAAAVPFVAVTGLKLFQWRIQAAVEAKLQLSTSDGMSNVRPEVQSVKLATLVLHQEDNHKGSNSNPAVVAQLAAAVAEPWPESILGLESRKALNSVALLDDPSIAVGADGGGVVSRWDTRSGERLWARPVSRRILQVVAATPDGAVVAAADDRAIHILRRGHTEVAAVAVPDAPQDMAVSNDGRWLVYAVEGELHRIDLLTMSADTVGSFAEILAIRASQSGAILSMTRSGDRITVLDTATGSARWTVEVAHDPLMSGALAADGSVAVTGADHQLYWSDGRSVLQPTGQYVPDSLTAMAATSNGLVVWSSAAQGTHVYDAWNHLRLPPICRELSFASGLVLSPAEDRVDCAGAGTHDIWRMGIDRPTATAPQGIASVPDLKVKRLRGPVSEVIGTPQGLLQVTLTGTSAGQGGLVILDPSGATLHKAIMSSSVMFGSQGSTGKPSSIALTSDGATLAVGSDDGDVAEYDAIDGRTLVRASRWQAPDHSIIRRISYETDAMTVTTDTLVWRVPSCAGCAAHPDRLVARVMQRQMPCYSVDLLNVVPADLLRRLGTRLCQQEK